MNFSSTVSLSNISTTSSTSEDAGFYGKRRTSVSTKKPAVKRKIASFNLPPPTIDEPEFYPFPRSTQGDNSYKRKEQTVYMVPSPMDYTVSTKLTLPRAPAAVLSQTAGRFQPILCAGKSDIRPVAVQYGTPGLGYTIPSNGRACQHKNAPAYSF